MWLQFVKSRISKGKWITLLGILLISHAQAQFKSVTVGIDGLTCSMCSNSVEKLIRQLDFVASVTMDLNQTTAEITFKEGKKVNVNEIAKKVVDSGFSVRSIQALFTFTDTEAKEGKSYVYEGDEYIFLKVPDAVLTGDKNITFIGKKYMSAKEFVHWKDLVAKNKGSSKSKSQVYHITL